MVLLSSIRVLGAGNGAGKLKQQKQCKRNKYKNRNKCDDEDVIDF